MREILKKLAQEKGFYLDESTQPQFKWQLQPICTPENVLFAMVYCQTLEQVFDFLEKCKSYNECYGNFN